ncbi:MAG: hypothetical protein COT26_01000 [Candidatus Kerfeldbacteria bacterium CG08_land_8_20_14_0_20_43_14]|uniref:Uncharacterized protein n=1 Tax=Candidatus Kerfeldbacteria bacterium CG08_land_8_20_14_0_20_43_14 TaxID=2014246 RepID=A0A2H0YQT7_9BACT|nr:MAG: hypothetical protein COT26_01000 [Candidatus Kerfeldbacteria bacterium CG08_land_8_20_14_0_20_43_14]
MFLGIFLLQIFTVAALLSILSFLISNSGWIEAMTAGFLISIFFVFMFQGRLKKEFYLAIAKKFQTSG